MSEYSSDTEDRGPGYWDNDQWVSTAPQQALTAENLSSAYQAMFGKEAPQDWIQQTQAAYDPSNTLSHVMANVAAGAAADATPFQNAPGAQGGFTSGADYYIKQGFIPGGYTYEGVPTEFYDRQGNLVASYGLLQEKGGQPKSTASNAWRWNQALTTPQGYETSRAIPRTDWNNAFQQGLTGAAFAMSPVIAGYGLASLGALEGLGGAGELTYTAAAPELAGAGEVSSTLVPAGEAGGSAWGGSGISSAYAPTSLSNAPASLSSLGLDLATPSVTGTAGLEGGLGTGIGVGAGATSAAAEALASMPGYASSAITLADLIPESVNWATEAAASPWYEKIPLKDLLKYGLTAATLAGAAKAAQSGGKGSGQSGSGGMGSLGLQSLGDYSKSSAPKFDWGYQAPTAPIGGKAYGQQILRPQYFAKGGDTGLAALRSESKVRHVDPEVVKEIMDEMEDYAPEERVPMFDNLPSKEEIVSFYLNHHPNIAGSEDYDPRMQGIEHAELGASAPVGEGSLSAGLHGLRIQNPPEYNEQGVNTAYNRSGVFGAGLGYEMPFAGGTLRGDVSKNFSRPGVSGMLNYSKEFAKGGLSDLGGYSDGGRMLKGPGDGMSDSIPASIENKRPARLATDEFVVPADVVSHLGNGSSDAGAKVLYKMMDRIRQARTGNKKQGKQINPSKYLPG